MTGEKRWRWSAIVFLTIVLLLLVLGRSSLLAFRLPGSQAPSSPASRLPNFQAPVPHRIVSLIPSVTEMLFAIGDGDDVVGVSSFDHYPPAVEGRTRVGGLLDPDFERILA